MRQALSIAVALAIGLGGLLVARAISIDKNEHLAGDGVYRLEDARTAELEGFGRILEELRRMNQEQLAGRLAALRADGTIWVAPRLRAGRWAIYISTLHLVRRIYIERGALVEPEVHFFQGKGDLGLSDDQRQAFALLTLCGTLVHELAHYDGIHAEAGAYHEEVQWYRRLKETRWYKELDPTELGLHDWAIDNCVKSAQAAARKAG